MTAMGHIHAAPLTSPRLRRVLALLSDGRPRTTREIVRKARVMAVMPASPSCSTTAPKSTASVNPPPAAMAGASTTP